MLKGDDFPRGSWSRSGLRMGVRRLSQRLAHSRAGLGAGRDAL